MPTDGEERWWIEIARAGRRLAQACDRWLELGSNPALPTSVALVDARYPVQAAASALRSACASCRSGASAKILTALEATERAAAHIAEIGAVSIVDNGLATEELVEVAASCHRQFDAAAAAWEAAAIDSIRNSLSVMSGGFESLTELDLDGARDDFRSAATWFMMAQGLD